MSVFSPTRLTPLLLASFLVSPERSLADGLFVSGVSPASGPATGGTLVTITGHEFTGAIAVNFGVIPAASFTVISDTLITAVSPAEAPGTVDIRVTVNDPTTTPIEVDDQFTFISTATPTPTLHEWSMIVLALLLTGMGYLALMRRANLG